MPRNPHRHPDDITAEDNLIAALGDARRNANLTQWQVAATLGVNHRTVSYVESGTAESIACHTATGHARAVNHRLQFHADGLTCVDETPATALLAALAATTTRPQLRDEYLTTLLIHRLAANRWRFGTTTSGVARAMGTTVGAVEQLERKATCRKVATIQRYVRALGGVPRADLAPDAVEVAA